MSVIDRADVLTKKFYIYLGFVLIKRVGICVLCGYIQVSQIYFSLVNLTSRSTVVSFENFHCNESNDPISTEKVYRVYMYKQYRLNKDDNYIKNKVINLIYW